MKLKTVNPEVFDDEELCDNKIEACFFLNDWTCSLFHDTGNDNFTQYIFRDEAGNSIKCQECKKHYQESKDENTKN